MNMFFERIMKRIWKWYANWSRYWVNYFVLLLFKISHTSMYFKIISERDHRSNQSSKWFKEKWLCQWEFFREFVTTKTATFLRIWWLFLMLVSIRTHVRIEFPTFRWNHIYSLLGEVCSSSRNLMSWKRIGK